MIDIISFQCVTKSDSNIAKNTMKWGFDSIKYTGKITVKAPISMRIHTLYTNKQINFSFINNIWKNNKPKEFILPPDKDEGFYR
jgi:hypothetical protein